MMLGHIDGKLEKTGSRFSTTFLCPAPYFLGLLRPAPYSRLRHGSRPIFSPLTPDSSSEELQATESLARNCDRRATTSNHKKQDAINQINSFESFNFFVFEMPSQSQCKENRKSSRIEILWWGSESGRKLRDFPNFNCFRKSSSLKQRKNVIVKYCKILKLANSTAFFL